MVVVLNSVMELLAYFIGPIFGSYLAISPFDLAPLERYSGYLLAILSWFALEKLIELYISTSTNSQPTKETNRKVGNPLLFGLSLFVFMLMTVALLQFVQVRSTKEVFHLFLLSLLFHSIYKLSLRISSVLVILISKFFYLVLASAISFQIILQSVHWQHYFVGTGIGLTIVALELTILCLYNKNVPKKGKKTTDFIPRLYAISLFFGPTIIVFLSMSHQLPKYYLLSLLPLIAARGFPETFTSLWKSKSGLKAILTPEQRQKFVMQNNLLVLCILVLIALLTTFF